MANAPGVEVTIDGVGKTWATQRGPVEAVAGVTLSIGAGEFVSIVGPSGCGKSTLLRIVAGLERATTGTVRVGGEEVTRPDPRHGVVFQRAALFPWLDVLENVTFGPRMQGLGKTARAEWRERARGYLRAVGLEGFERHKVYELSGGMMHRVSLARVLINRPTLLLMDEPFGALDAQTRLLMQDLLRQVLEEDRSSVLFITHDVDEALVLSDRALVMTARPGRIKEEFVVPFARPRDLGVLGAPDFAAMKADVLASIRAESLESISLEVEELRRHRR
jgi:NitT/TauT family transport system ATP-binding protein